MQRYGGRFPLRNRSHQYQRQLPHRFGDDDLTERQVNPNWRLVLVVGFLGGYTTFSSFEWGTFRRCATAASGLASFNVLGSVALGYLAVWCGSALVRR